MRETHGGTGGRTERDHLERSRRKWDRWSDWYHWSERDLAPILDDAVDRLALEPGDAVLDVGCGPGVNFGRLRDRVGPEGRIVAVDYSPEMVERARERAAANGWDNVEVIRADASSVAFEERFDAALASESMSVMPDVAAAAGCVHDALRPGARFVVFDFRPVPSGPLRMANPLITRFLRWFANWNPDEDVLPALRATFGRVDVDETYAAGTAYRAVAHR